MLTIFCGLKKIVEKHMVSKVRVRKKPCPMNKERFQQKNPVERNVFKVRVNRKKGVQKCCPHCRTPFPIENQQR